MSRLKKAFIVICFLASIIYTGANIYAEFVYCSTAFPGETCHDGGCQLPEDAKACKLKNCLAHDGGLFQHDCNKEQLN